MIASRQVTQILVAKTWKSALPSPNDFFVYHAMVSRGNLLSVV
jgi:hypothetical protein